MPRQVIYDAGGVLSTIDGILQDDYVVQQIQNTVNMATYLLSKLRSEKTTAGRQFIVSVQFGVGEGQGSSGENEQLPDEGAGEFDQAFGNVRYQYGALYITGQAIEATDGKASYVSALKQALKDCRDGFKLNTQRMVHSDGTGTLGTITVGANSVTQTVTNPYGLTYITADLDASQRTRPYRRNMQVYFVTTTEMRRIVGVDPVAGTIELDTAVSTTIGERIVRGDATGRTSDGKEVRGLSEMIKTTGTYFGIPRAGTPEWQGNRIQVGSGSGGPVTEEAMQIAFDTNEIYGTGAPTLALTDHKTRRRYVSLLQAQKRFVSPMKLEGGFDAIEFNGKPLVVDKDSPPQRIRFIRMEDIVWMVMKQIGWINRDGTVLKWVDQKDAYRAYLAAYRDLFNYKPANGTELYDITS